MASATAAYDAGEPVLCAQWSSASRAPNLLALGTASRLSLLSFSTSAALSTCLSPLKSVALESSAERIAWSPRASVNAGGRLLLCVAGGDGLLHLLSLNSGAGDGDLETEQDEDDSSHVLKGHAARVTALGYSGDGQLLASTSDDCTLRVWDVANQQQTTVLRLSAPGVGVMWHPQPTTEELLKQVFVAERGGTVRLCHTEQRHPLLSLRCDLGPLAGIDWCSLNPALVGAPAGDSWVIWNAKSSAVVHATEQLGRPHARFFKWCRTHESAFAVASATHVALCQLNEDNTQEVVAEADGQCSDLSWHPTRPLCCAAMGGQLVMLPLDA